MGSVYEGDDFRVVPTRPVEDIMDTPEVRKIQDQLKAEVQNPEARRRILGDFSVQELSDEIDRREQKAHLGKYDPSNQLSDHERYADPLYIDGFNDGVKKTAKQLSTKELVEELVSREGVESVWVEPYDVYSIMTSTNDKFNKEETGPAIIIRVVD